MTSSSDQAENGAERTGGETGDETRLQTLSRMIENLEEQLDRMLGINAALEKDLAAERDRRLKLERSLEDLQEQLKRAQQQTADEESLRAEVRHLGNERARLAKALEQLAEQLAAAEQDSRKAGALAERRRAERDDSLEELQSVEAQFERAMEMVSDLKTRLAVISEERDTLRERCASESERLRLVEKERDALFGEVENSKTSLEEIRRSLAEAYSGAASENPDDRG